MTGVRRKVRTLTPACVSGQSKQHVGMKTRVCVRADNSSCRYNESAHTAQRHGGFTSAVGLVWNNKPAAFWHDSAEAKKKRVKPQTLCKQPLTSAATTSQKITRPTLIRTLPHRERRLMIALPRLRQLFNFLFSRWRNTNNCFSLRSIAPRRLTTPVICALRILIRPGAGLGAAYGAARMHAN